jgi:hypothetical protein
MPDFPIPIWTDRAATNRANAQHSTGPSTPAGKIRSSLNALTHGLTGRTVLLPSEDPATHQRHTQDFFDEYKPQGPTERQLVQELIDTSWRINRVPALEAEVLNRAANPPTEEAAIAFDIVDAHQAIDKLALYSHRLSRQFHKTLEQLLDIQAERLTKGRTRPQARSRPARNAQSKGHSLRPSPGWLRFFKRPDRSLQPAFDPSESVAPYRVSPFPRPFSSPICQLNAIILP